MTSFDPFTATLEDAQAQPDAYAMHGAVDRWANAQSIMQYRARYEKYPIEGVSICVCHGLIAPDWLAWAFMRQYHKVVMCEVATWDEAFGAAQPQGKRLSTLRLQRQFGFRLQELFSDDKFQGRKKLPRTLEGRQEAARLLGITEKQVRVLLPKTRTNVKGHKPYGSKTFTAAHANDPFSLVSRKTPKI